MLGVVVIPRHTIVFKKGELPSVLLESYLTLLSSFARELGLCETPEEPANANSMLLEKVPCSPCALRKHFVGHLR